MKQQNIIYIEILASFYAPCEEQLQQKMNTRPHGSTSNIRVDFDSLLYTRDVAPFVRAMLATNKLMENEKNADSIDFSDNLLSREEIQEKLFHQKIASFNSVIEKDNNLRSRTEIPLFTKEKPVSMNGAFGDPIPGVSKRLHVHYSICVGPETALTGNEMKESISESLYHWETYVASFSEHESKISLRCHHALDRATKPRNNTLVMSGIDSSDNDQTGSTEFNTKTPISIAHGAEEAAGSDQNLQKKFISATLETALPLLLQYITIVDRVQCRLVCSSWRKTIQDWGIASVIDDTDVKTFPLNCNRRRILRGLTQQSYYSLHTLSLCNTPEIETSDLHPVIPFLHKLRSLDVSRCKNLNDTTLSLLAQYLHVTLEVLYLKGLRQVSDEGIVAIAQACLNIQVLEISYIRITDNAGTAIGENLTKLRALFMRDNYLLTNQSIDVITQRCRQLAQLTLWGCIELDHLSCGPNDAVIDSSPNQLPTSLLDPMKVTGMLSCTQTNLVSLNLWGCHRLSDETAKQFRNMRQLKTIILSECHQITDNFVCVLAMLVPKLHHLHLGYCKRITDNSINAIATHMKDLYSLDLSFCTRITISSISSLLQQRSNSLVELRLKQCRQLEIGIPLLSLYDENAYGPDGWKILDIIESNDNSCCLSILDVRFCGSCNETFLSNGGYHPNDPFVLGMTRFDFHQKVPGFFVRPTRWNHDIHYRLVKSILSQKLLVAEPTSIHD